LRWFLRRIGSALNSVRPCIAHRDSEKERARQRGEFAEVEGVALGPQNQQAVPVTARKTCRPALLVRSDE
jgi:hypothetical protein